MEWTGMLVVSLRGVSFGFWSRFGCSGQNVIIFSHQGLVKGCTRGNNKTERILILYIYSIHIKLVSFRGLHKLRPRPDWSLLGFKFKIFDEHSRQLHLGDAPPPSGLDIIRKSPSKMPRARSCQDCEVAQTCNHYMTLLSGYGKSTKASRLRLKLAMSSCT